jgi:serine/threonine protein kinase
MKSNNILLDFNNEEEVPHLVLSDFGSALATGNWLVEHRNGADLGGNLALMAPEVRRSRPGPNSIVDFEMADTWSAGTLAFEIFTRFSFLLNSIKFPFPIQIEDGILSTRC